MSASSAQKRGSNARNASLSPPPSKRKIESTTTKKAVTNFFTPVSKKEPDQITWKIVHGTLLVAKYNPSVTSPSTEPLTKRKIAAFDLDYTLIQTSSGNIFSKDSSDWRWWHASVPSNLKRLHANGYHITVLTNQGSISLKNDPKTIKSDQRSLASFKAKVGFVLGQLDFPVTLFAATARDQYRKPRTRMWHELLEEFDLDEHDGPDLTACFFVGDAGGRPARSDAKADHSCSDRNFATNVGIEFKTPEEHFLQETPQPFVRDLEPRDYLGPYSSVSTNATAISMDEKNILDVALLCGSPGAGKSTFYWQHLKPMGYERINQDTLKTGFANTHGSQRENCIQMATKLVSEGKSVAIDNTNADLETRALWVQLAQKLGVPIRCVYFSAPVKLCEHNDSVRALAGGPFNPEKRSILPHSAFSSFASRFKEPTEQEGFQSIIKVEFQFQGDPEQRRLWSQYWS